MNQAKIEVRSSEIVEREYSGPGICDGCGQQAQQLVVLNCAPVAGACLCPGCCPRAFVKPETPSPAGAAS